MRNFLVPLFLVILVAAGFEACNTDPYIASNLTPSGDYLRGRTTDSFHLYARNTYHDSVVANNLGTVSLGLISNNPVFGKLTASVYAQFNLPDNKNQFDFGAGVVIDSAFVTFPYRSTFGDTITKMNVAMVLVNASSSNRIAEGATYYSNKNFELDITSFVGAKNNLPIKVSYDSIKVYGSSIAPHLRLPITNTTFLNSFASQSSTGAFADNVSFHNYLNGIYIYVSNTCNGLLQLANNDVTLSGLTVYYHNSSASQQTAFFPINGAGTVNNFSHDFAGSQAQQIIQQSTGNDSVIFVSGLAGLKSKITIPGLSNLKHMLINRAQIILEDVNPSYTGLFAVPGNLLLTRYSASLNAETSLDDLTEGSPISGLTAANYYGGLRNGNTYTFNIARYLQKLVNGIYVNDGFYLEINNAAERPGQVVLGGGTHSKYKIKLKIIYTKI